MEHKKLNIGIVFGGKSAEHEISILSAKNVLDALDRNKYQPVLIHIDKKGAWHVLNERSLNEAISSGTSLPEKTGHSTVVLGPQSEGTLIPTDTKEHFAQLDVVFPILHGPFGEDGTVQGLLKLANVPFVGAGVLGSAVGMDKDVMKRLLREAGIPIGKFICLHKNDPEPKFDAIEKELGLPIFVKPANLGSSVGISKVENEAEFSAALRLAFGFDRKIIVEEFISGREIECAVLGNDHPMASVPGEVISHHNFYSYEAKYLDEKASRTEIPARLTPEQTEEVRSLAIKTFKTLCCEGLGRVDCFLTEDGTFLVNEINTLPGFTEISMYPKMWAHSGISYPELIDRLIQLAIERFGAESQLKTSYS